MHNPIIDFPHISAIIFDMDGVLLDSEPIYQKAIETYFSELGIHLRPREYNQFVGTTLPLMWEKVKKKYALSQPLYSLVHETQYRMIHAIENHRSLLPNKNLVSFLQYLQKQQIPCAVASSSPRKLVDVVLGKLQIRHYFSCTCAGTEVKKGKPAPDIFLHASKKLSVAPEACAVIEDSTNGITAAKKAKMFCVAYIPSQSNTQNVDSADRHISDFKQLFTKKGILYDK